MDLFKIGSNIASMQALNSLYKLNSKLSVHQERLSTGKRVNSARDDTALRSFSVAKNAEIQLPSKDMNGHCKILRMHNQFYQSLKQLSKNN